MIDNFEKWKEELLYTFPIAIHGLDDDNEYERISNKFLKCVDSVDYKATEEIAGVLFSLFTDEEDYEILESVIDQLDVPEIYQMFNQNFSKAF